MSTTTPRGPIPRTPEQDPRLGIAFDPPWKSAPRPTHRLVAIGDSLTHGFQSGAIFNTDLSYPAIIAHELGWADRFRFPRYDGFGGLPFNIEMFLRDLEARFGRDVDWWETVPALLHARRSMDKAEDYWERGPGSVLPSATDISHNLGIFGWDLRDALDKTAAVCVKRLANPTDNLLRQTVDHADDLAALRVLPAPPDGTLTQFTAAARLGEDVGHGMDPDHGIETLVVFLGANNALGSVLDLKYVLSDGENNAFEDLDAKAKFTVWQVEHFSSELEKVAAAVHTVKARHVIWCTVPHVTIAPIARGVSVKMERGSSYFPYYTRPWITDRDFDPTEDPHLTGEQAREIDAAIDGYNYAIADVVRQARDGTAVGAGGDRKDWYLLEIVAVLDRLGSRRYIEDPLARPPWWQPYPMPSALRALDPVPNTHFLTSDGQRRVDGGVFSLDGVHPTTVGYGIIAQEIVNVMRLAGVPFFRPDGVTPRQDPVLVDFERLVRRDTLINHPPGNLTSGLRVLAWADETLDLLRRSLRFGI
ncbi:hypothetical protein [Streptomyces sp. NPDC047042]|uniref:hypothetical protein n=1 Tax=Streptomyces sp. NPDC047042 TaxID=3154807 RepID=UPI0033FBA09B